MKRKLWIPAALIVLLLAAGYIFRGDIRDAWSRWNAPPLPSAQKYRQPVAGPVGLTGDDSGSIEGGVATSEHYALVSSPPKPQIKVDPFAVNGTLPAEANLDVPFMSQAPTGDWGMPYQEACEEASSIMVDAFYRGITGNIPPDQATKAINAVVDYENKTLGFYKDTTAVQTADFIKGYFKYKDVLIQPITGASQIKQAIANGYPVIIPADGKTLPNPNFRNGGPVYHMLVIKGYTATRFITNDPGTRNGADFTYTYDGLLNSAHDWNGGDVAHGAPVMVVVIPNPS
jgi:hypothetical protein